MIRDGFKKVAQSGGVFIVATFFNPTTKETYTHCVRDYDYADGSRDDDEAYYMPIDEDAVRLWKKFNGVIQEGDTIEVVKGRKVPIGTVAKVERLYDWKDVYGRVQTRYAVLSNGLKTSVDNCKIID